MITLVLAQDGIVKRYSEIFVIVLSKHTVYMIDLMRPSFPLMLALPIISEHFVIGCLPNKF